LEPGQTITFADELAGERLPRILLWKGLEYEKRSRNRQLFHGILLGITGLLAVFLTAVFAANHKAIFPSAALFTWCVLAYLCVDFGFWHKLFNVRPEENAQYRAAGEAAMTATLLVFLYTFLRLGRWHGFVRMLLGLWMVAQFVLIGLAFLDPRLAATFSRLSMVAITAVGALITLFLALRGQDRALSLVPTWIMTAVWLFASALVLTGRLGGDVVVTGWTAGLVLLVVLIGFTVTQYAFRSVEPLYGLAPDDQRLRSLAIEGTGAALFDWNARRDEVKIGPMIEAALGRPGEERIEPVARFTEQMHPTDRQRFNQLLAGIRERGTGQGRLEFRLRHVDNNYRWFELDLVSVPSSDRRLVRCVGLIRETTDAKRAQERLLHDAVHDSLTGLPNRALFIDRLNVALLRARLEPLVKPTVFLVDLDRFKSVNSSFGLVVGDSLLITIARRLQRLAGPTDALGRIGGDQFALLFTATRDEREQRLLAEDIRAALKAPISIGNQEIVLTGSIGMSEYDGRQEATAQDLLADAETAMHRAKVSGSDQIERFSAPMRADKDDRVALESELRQAIEKKQLRVVFQPIMYLRKEELAGFEALVRWDHPRLGTLNPAEFVPLAEESDLIVRLGSYVLQAAVTEAQRWQKEFPRPHDPLFVSVNVSSRQLFRPDLISEARHIMGRGLLPKGALRLEITESLVMENPEQATKVLEDLLATGVQLALDDFGTGYSSLTYLNTFPFSTIKVDRALVHLSSQDGSSSAILRSIVALAHELGKTVVAEGVETEDDVGLLRTIGCEYAQGFLYGGPVGAREVMQMLKTARKADRRLRRSGMFRLRSRRREEAAAAGAAERPRRAQPGRRAPSPAASGAAAANSSALGRGALAQARLRAGAPPPSAAAGPSATGARPSSLSNGRHGPPDARLPTAAAVAPIRSAAAALDAALSRSVGTGGPPAGAPQPGRPPLPQPEGAPGTPAPIGADAASRSLARLQAQLAQASAPTGARPNGSAAPAPASQPASGEAGTAAAGTLPPSIAASLARLANLRTTPIAPGGAKPPTDK
jgi:diguanylate cyclase (GGDEF)-like protein